MKQFDYDKIMQDNTVVHCDTEEKANNLLQWADSKGLKWASGSEYSEYNNWEGYKESTCYKLKLGSYASVKFYRNTKCNILTYEEVLIEEKEMENKETQTEFRVGDKVWSFVYGWGEVSTITNDEYPIYVKFKSKIDNDNFIVTYLKNGSEYRRENQSLFFDEIKFEAPKRPLPSLEVDTKVLVEDCETGEWSKRYFSHFDEDGNMCCFDCGRTSWSGKGTSRWSYWKLADGDKDVK